MNSLLRTLIVFSTIFICSSTVQAKELRFNLMEVMEDAEYKQVEYRAIITFKTPVPSKIVTPYVYDKKRRSLTKLDTVKLRNNQQFDLKFLTKFDSDVVLVFLLDKVGFSFNERRPAQLLCFQEIRETYLAKNLTCDFATTATYLFSSVNIKGDVINMDTIDTWLDYHEPSMFNNQTFQNYLSLFTSAMVYMTRYPNHLTLEMNDNNFLNVYRSLAKEYIHRISTRRYADINSFEHSLVNISSLYKNFGYKIYKDKDFFFDITLSGLPLVKKHSIYLNDFLAGIRDMTFFNKSSFRLINTKFIKETNTLKFSKWPWFKYVKVKVDNNEEQIITLNNYQLPSEFTKITLTPIGAKGSFVALTITPESLKVM